MSHALSLSRRMRRTQSGNLSGMTLMEILLVLAIAAFILIGAVVLFNQADENSRGNRVQGQLTNLASTIRSAYMTSPNYTGLTAAGLITAQQVPPDMVSGTAIRSAFGTVDIAPTGANNDRFTITMNGLPRKACTNMLTSVSSGNNVVSIQVGSGSAYDVTASGPYNPVTAGGACTAARSNVTFTFQ